MIRNIIINNYALIDKTNVSFEKGLSIITGETGAGKSILLGAIGLTLGQRADANVIMNEVGKSIIEIHYDLKGYNLDKWFAENDLDYEDITVVRREITTEGKSRAFINDTPVNNKILKDFGNFLIDIHSQHQSLLLGKPEYQIDILDSFCGNGNILKEYRDNFSKWKRLNTKLSDVLKLAEEAEKEEDYLKFQFNQLDESNLRPEELNELEEELKLLNNTETIKSTFSEVNYKLSSSEQSVILTLKNLRNKLSNISDIVKEAADYEERINSILFELEDIADEAERFSETLEFSPSRVSVVNERLNVLYDLLHKHRTENVETLIEIKENIFTKLQSIQSFTIQIEDIKREIAIIEDRMTKLCDKLHKARENSIKGLKNEMSSLLVDLGIKHAVFEVNLTRMEDFNYNGKNEVKFLFSANKNQAPGELSKIASGGEVSRLMLSLKYILSKTKKLPAIIFDEIDTGVSGEIAHKMARMMKDMSKRMQVISISHLPQIAATGNNHYKVYKEDNSFGTVSKIRLLTEEERINEIAGMISGSKITSAAIENARLLLNM